MDGETAALLERADALRRSGRTMEAIAAYTELLDREPGLADSWYNLGWLQKQERQFEAALEAYEEALRRNVRDPEEVHLNRAVILSDHLGRPEDAEAELDSALKLNPAYVPALLNLGNLHEDLGRRAEAERAYRQALEIEPENSLALSRLAGVIDAGSQAAATIAGDMRDAISGGRSADERADLGFALARLLDARGEYRTAFAASDAANRASRESLGRGFPGYDRSGHEHYVDRMIAAFSEPAYESGAAAPAVFIVGMFRSGSTLIEQILASHDCVVSGGELDLVPALVSQIGGYPEAAAAADEEVLEQWRAFYLKGLAPFAREGAIVTDKRPDNFLHLGFIKTLFPGAKIVHTHRNRLDNLLSLHFLHLGPSMPYALDLADSAHWHGEYERLMAHWKRLYPEDIFDLDYDELVRRPESQVKRLLKFLGVDWDESVLDFHRRSGAVKTASVWQVREPMHTRSSGRWRNYSEELRKALGELSSPN